MLHILDARTGEPVPAAPALRGLTRIEAVASGLDPTALRVLLTADLLVRALELGGTPVWTTLTAPGQHAELRSAAAALAVRPFEDGHDLAAGLGEAQAIHVTTQPPDTFGDGPVVRVAPVRWEQWEETPGISPHPAPAALLRDPEAFRLALLRVPRSETVRLDSAALGEAAGWLARWRRAVAGWARQPSRPVPESVRARLRSAWEDDLDLPGVLQVLRDVESAPDLPDGARFETYAYADRLLALDLARDLGSLA
ncbi:hypothetical protein GQF42_09020 [Streptomyces broussonetiae]|uniref:Cysteinyl-tRNA synthetase n=1 Tax=Streptomyces broussonetiae TaxID=2686304 RepID=A0A6I6N0C5_9ACTN|nr:hypothetical protein [Streptomyces broussonetiae]QHA03390.1 hypothetical protein GQF42_09020 [Streptomyces broussonetiae]